MMVELTIGCFWKKCLIAVDRKSASCVHQAAFPSMFLLKTRGVAFI